MVGASQHCRAAIPRSRNRSTMKFVSILSVLAVLFFALAIAGEPCSCSVCTSMRHITSYTAAPILLRFEERLWPRQGLSWMRMLLLHCVLCADSPAT